MQKVTAVLTIGYEIKRCRSDGCDVLAAVPKHGGRIRLVPIDSDLPEAVCALTAAISEELVALRRALEAFTAHEAERQDVADIQGS